MVEVRIAELGELSESDLQTAHALVRSAFGASFRAHDWLHALDGVHVVIADDDMMLAHAAVVTRTLRHGDEEFDTGYVEAVAVRSDQQGRGLGRLAMEHAESVIRARHHIGALNAVQEAAAFYAGRGWRLWDGPTHADTPTGTIDTYDPADRIFLLPLRAMPPTSDLPLICDWRVGDLW